MRIGELAVEAAVDVQTIRYYEREGLIEPPSRTASGYRSYGASHLERLNFVRHCRSLDMPLAEIRQILDVARDRAAPCEEVDRLVRAHLDRVRAKRLALESLEARLVALSKQCANGHRVADCGILGDMIRAARTG